MSDKKFCPECNAPLEGDEMFCDNCGATLKSVNEENTTAIATNRETEGDNISRSNIMGSVNKTTTNNTNNNLTTNKIDNSSSTSTVTNTSSSVDNSTVNNTTIVMGGKTEAEFCEVCGNPFEGKHARCPKCGKSICFDCKVKGKNRCVECEKKAINEYRVAFQELLLTTNGEIGAAGRQMMNRKAQELDIQDVKKDIENELLEMYKPQQKAQQPTIIPTAAATAAAVAAQAQNDAPEKQKGLGSISGGPAMQPIKNTSKNSGSSNKMWMFIAGGVAAILLVYVLFGGNGNSNAPQAEAPKAETAQEQAPAQPVQPAQPAQPAQQPAVQQPVAAPAVAETPAPAVEKPDAKYEAGMKAYENGDGLKALENFKASGSAKSYYMIGVIYESGCGSVGKNAMMARKNFKTAAKMGSSEAKAKL